MIHRIILCALFILSLPFCSFSEPPAPTLRVLTYNIHHGEGMDGKFDYERLTKVILNVQPDVVALQEVDRKTRRASGVDQAEWLGKLTNMKTAYGRAMYYSDGEYGEAILSRFPIAESHFHPLPFTTGREPRQVLTALIQPDNGLPEFLFADTHLCHQSEELRTDQARTINSLLPDAGGTPIILAGDLNSQKGSTTMNELLSKRWVDATKPISIIDYILLRPNDPWRIVEVKTIDEKVASDHDPVLAVLEWKGEIRRSPAAESDKDEPDWLVQGVTDPVKIEENPQTHEIILHNGLIQRTFRLQPNLATISYKNLQTEMEYIRGVKPEASVTINGSSYEIGGLLGQIDYAYLNPAWLKEMTSSPRAFQFSGYTTGICTERFPWKRKRYSADLPWPPKGKSVTFNFVPPQIIADNYKGLTLSIHYEMYEGVPILCKWLEMKNGTNREIVVDQLTTEILAVVERDSEVNLARSTRPRKYPNYIDPNDLAATTHPRIHIQSDYAFCGGGPKSADQTTFWEPDPEYLSQVCYDRDWPHLLTSRYPYGPGVHLPPGESLVSFRTFELLHDSDDDERRGLAIRRMLRVLAPWCTENPIMMHLRYADSESIRRAVDQCAAVGFEMIVLSFGSGINMESEDPNYIARVKADMDYAHSQGIEIGGYSLLSSRSAGPEQDVIDPNTGKPGAYFGSAPCLGSEWGIKYFEKLQHFMEATGCDLLEHDGSYPGDPCASTKHPGHHGLADSQFLQHQKITRFYQWCRAQGIYLNVPDYYLLNGTNKIPMGYRETNWSLPRALQIITGRQNIYDGTWSKTPSMGWMFVPLVEYQGGGAAATIEPLSEHLDTYEAFLAQNFGSGVQACYRGPRLYDTEATKAVVQKWTAFYKQNRDILDSDIIHVRRPDGRDIDAILHVNPKLKTRGLAMVYNPTDHTITRSLSLPLYYTGLTTITRIREQQGMEKTYTLDRNYNIKIPINLGANERTWFLIE